MKRVVIESPFSSGTTPRIGAVEERNLRYLRACMKECLGRGEAPYASHGLYIQPGVIDDHDPVERALGMQAGFAWGDVGELVAVYLDLGCSPGMMAGIERAALRWAPVEERRLGGKWAECWDPALCPIVAANATYGSNRHAYDCPLWRAPT
jgi:hypothetical protein